MDLIYPPSRQQNISREIHVGEFLLQYNNRLQKTLFKDHDSTTLQTNTTQSIFTLMGKSDYALEQQSDPALLNPRSLLKESSNWKEIPPEGLATLKTLENQMNMMAKNQGYKKRLRTLRKTQLPSFSAEGGATTPLPMSTLCSDVVLTIRVYKEFKQQRKSKEKVPAYSQDLLVLGSQRLYELRDTIHCLNDSSCSTDDQGKPPETLDHVSKVKDLIPASTFFFGNTFYADDRYCGSEDYGRFIESWAQSHPKSHIMGPFEHQTMQSTFLDLKIRLGVPYVFMHLGSCEHLVTFMDLRLRSPSDPLDDSVFPLIERAEPRTDFCDACDLFFSDWIVEGNERLPHDPTLLCHKCFIGFHYNGDEKVGSFVHHPYPQNEKPVFANQSDRPSNSSFMH